MEAGSISALEPGEAERKGMVELGSRVPAGERRVVGEAYAPPRFVRLATPALLASSQALDGDRDMTRSQMLIGNSWLGGIFQERKIAGLEGEEGARITVLTYFVIR